MRNILALVAVAQIAVGFGPSPASGAVRHERPSNWRIVRTEQREFCAANVAIIDLAHSALHGSIGACDPDRKAPARQIAAEAENSDITALRQLVLRLKSGALIDASCEAAQKANISLPGPETTIAIVRRSISVSADVWSPCLTDMGRRLVVLVDRTIRPLRALGLS